MTTSDFRKEFYKKYNSAYKIHTSDFTSQSIRKIWREYDFKYLPLISKYAKDIPILELGCGRGYLLEYLRNKGFNNLRGIDVSEEQIDISRQKSLNVEVADVFEYLNNDKEKFKIIFALDFIEHFSKEELIQLFDGIYKTLDRGGTFIFHTPNGQSFLASNLVYGDLTHLTVFNPLSALQLLRLSGFNDITFKESGPVPKNLYGVIRVFLWQLVKLGHNFLKLIESGKRDRILTQNFIGAAKK
jgi:2-polyprenyl-3-methyl-5-hydroxy-6-metoxy-1,4-benzoquinol methylase